MIDFARGQRLPRFLLAPILAALIGAVAVETSPVSVGAAGTALAFSPTSSVTVEGGTAFADVTVSSVTNLGGYQIALQFNPAILQVTSLTDSGFVTSGGNIVVCNPASINNAAGTASIGCSTVAIFGPPGPGVSRVGAVALVYAEFVGQSLGMTSLTLNGSTLEDPLGAPITATIASGSVTVGTGCTTDNDCDGVSNASDNCLNTANAGQENNDRNFIDNSPPYAPSTDDKTLVKSDAAGNVCESDDDNDGIGDTIEPGGAPCASATGATNPALLDTDGDRVTDGAECVLSSDPANALSKPAAPAPGTDTDADGLSNAFESSIGTNPAVKDTDGDGLQDGWEYKGYNSNPLVTDTDGDTVTDGCEVASINGDTVVNPGDQALMAAEVVRAVPAAAKLANFDLNKDGAINPGDQAFQASKVGGSPVKCPLVTPWP